MGNTDTKGTTMIDQDHHHEHSELSETALRVRALESVLTEKGYVDPVALDELVDYYENKVGPRNGARVIARAWKDPAFGARLMADATLAIAELGYSGRQGEHIVAVENTRHVHNMIVCTLCSCYPWPVLGLPPTWYKAAPYRYRAVRDPRGVLNLDAGRRHNQRTRDWRVGHLIRALRDKAEAAGITVTLVDERGTSSTCPACRSRIPKPPGRVLACPACSFTGHRDLTAATNIAARFGGGITPVILADVTHRRAGAHLPGGAPPRRDPRRRAHHRDARGSPGRPRPARTSLTSTGLGVARHLARSLNTLWSCRQVH